MNVPEKESQLDADEDAEGVPVTEVVAGLLVVALEDAETEEAEDKLRLPELVGAEVGVEDNVGVAVLAGVREKRAERRDDALPKGVALDDVVEEADGARGVRARGRSRGWMLVRARRACPRPTECSCWSPKHWLSMQSPLERCFPRAYREG